jgi:hypothetical protein
LFLPGEVAGLRGDVIAALGYVTNWYLVLGNESYFEAIGRPSLLKHLWSLAVEEQFYLLWPPVLALGLGVGATRWRERRVMLVALAGAAASALLMAFLYRPEVDPSRIYFGTDTRGAGLLIGAALAFAWTPWHKREPSCKGSYAATRRPRLVEWRDRLRRRWGWTTPLLLDVAGLTIRSVNPVRLDYMELTAHALAAREEGPVQLKRRLENFNLFLGPGGLATPDDIEALEACQEGFAATADDFSDISRGMHRDAGTVDELQMRSFWREWHANMLGAGHATHDEGRRQVGVLS